MSFLAPIFIAGALAASLPVIFHLVRRTPRGRVLFSSLLFLRPSPPRVTRRSRLDDLWLLLVRAGVLCLLALAFARPFWREAEPGGLARSGRRIAILLDVSASMRRDGVQERARSEAMRILDGLESADRVALFTFDDDLHERVGFDDGAGDSLDARRSILRRELESSRPSWGGTDLGGALVALADLLDGLEEPADSADFAGLAESSLPSRAPRIFLVSDLQRGSRLDRLDRYDWPRGVRLEPRPVEPARATNAGVSLLALADPARHEERLRVSVSNARDSTLDRFSLRWRGAEVDLAATDIFVPPGESRVAWLKPPAGGAEVDRLFLEGDDAPFDNSLWLAPPRRQRVDVLWVGGEPADDPAGLRYWFERALTSGGRREVRVSALAPEGPLPPDLGSRLRLAVVSSDIAPELERGLLEAARQGATLLVVAIDPGATRSLRRLLALADLVVEEGDRGGYAMLGEIDFTDPVFALFADPRFGDFTEIRFWRHRRLKCEALSRPPFRVLASFDRGDPAIVEKSEGRGRVIVLASGWHPRDGQLALSTKFVPLMNEILDRDPRLQTRRSLYRVGEPIALGAAGKPAAGARVRRPDGEEVAVAVGETHYRDADRPGLYEIAVSEERRRIAVNLAPEESLTVPLELEELEARGVRFGVEEVEARRERQMRDRELEGTQKLWKWGLVGVVLLSIFETWLAGRRSRAARVT